MLPMIVGHWTQRAACLREDPEIFFPPTEAGLGLEQITVAKEICHDCPVQAECLDHAITFGEGAGIWGGTTPEERRLLRRQAS